jgi:hypothetical protein
MQKVELTIIIGENHYYLLIPSPFPMTSPSFTLVLIKMNYGQIGDQTGLFNTTNPVFYTSGNRFVRRPSTFGNL